MNWDRATVAHVAGSCRLSIEMNDLCRLSLALWMGRYRAAKSQFKCPFKQTRNIFIMNMVQWYANLICWKNVVLLNRYQYRSFGWSIYLSTDSSKCEKLLLSTVTNHWRALTKISASVMMLIKSFFMLLQGFRLNSKFWESILNYL